MLRNFGIVAVALAVVQGCSAPSQPEPDVRSRERDVGPPVQARLDLADGAVADLIRKLIAEAEERPNDAAHRAALGMAYEVNGLPQAAAQSYEQAIALELTTPRWHYYLALVRSRLGDVDGALEAVDRTLELDGGYLPALLHRGQWSLDLGRVDDASETYRRALGLDGENPAAWMGIARVHLKQGRAREAAEILERLGADDRHPYVHQLLGLAYRQLGDLDLARAELARGEPRSPPGWPDPWHEAKAVYRAGFGAGLMKGQALLESGQIPEAIELFESLRQQRPDDAALLNNLAVAYRHAKQEDKVLQVLQSGLEKHPGYFPFHFNLSAAYYRLGNVERAIHHVNRVIEINPRLGRAYEKKGNYLLRARRLDEAFENFELALEYDARNPRVFLYAGVVAAELQRWPLAVERLEQALQLEPSQAAAYIALGRARAELGDFEAAQRALDRATELQPGSRQLAATRQKLEQLRAESP